MRRRGPETESQGKKRARERSRGEREPGEGESQGRERAGGESAREMERESKGITCA